MKQSIITWGAGHIESASPLGEEGYTTLRRTTLRLLSHFVEMAFCRSVILLKQVFVEYIRRNILCSPGRHIESADPVTMYHVIVRLRTLGTITDLKLTAVSIRVLVNETRG